ncbi:hypothetical protein [Streptomyces sp. NPDC095613]|uniref:hypothetical protein n=1 Tax=Streptomyces sp. NPDC095613 TaxID=3155540 RepID=UPI00332A0166
MTTPAAQPPRDRALGRGVSTLIPQSAAVSPGDRAAAALAALQTVPVHVGVLQAAVVLLEETARTGEDDASRSAAATTVDMLRTAIGRGSETTGGTNGSGPATD